MEYNAVSTVYNTLNLCCIRPVVLATPNRRALVFKSHQLGPNLVGDGFAQFWQMDIHNVLCRLQQQETVEAVLVTWDKLLRTKE